MRISFVWSLKSSLFPLDASKKFAHRTIPQCSSWVQDIKVSMSVYMSDGQVQGIAFPRNFLHVRDNLLPQFLAWRSVLHITDAKNIRTLGSIYWYSDYKLLEHLHFRTQTVLFITLGPEVFCVIRLKTTLSIVHSGPYAQSHKFLNTG